MVLGLDSQESPGMRTEGPAPGAWPSPPHVNFNGGRHSPRVQIVLVYHNRRSVGGNLQGTIGMGEPMIGVGKATIGSGFGKVQSQAWSYWVLYSSG